MYERNNCGDNKMVNKDESLKNALTEGVVASILASIIMMAITTIVKYFLQEYSQILPELQSMIICMLVFLALIYLEYIWVKHNKKNGEILPYISGTILGFGVFVSLLHFMTLLYLLNIEDKTDVFLSALKNETLFFFIIGNLVILYVFSHKLKIQIREVEFLNKTDKIVTNAMKAETDGIARDMKMYIDNVDEMLKKMDFDTAVTSTVIPFWERNGVIKTYLIANSSYPEYTWMFPGGHVLFGEDQSPETIAVSRAKDEANLTVSIVDINSVFEFLSLDDNQVSNMTIFKPPHFLYLFKLDDKTKCYNDKGHEYHMDAVYVAEINKEEKPTGDQKRITITLSHTVENLNDINQACHSATYNYYRKNNVNNSERKSVPDYVETMLYNAFIAYKKYKNL